VQKFKPTALKLAKQYAVFLNPFAQAPLTDLSRQNSAQGPGLE
jgi:hypothetical protein